MNITYGNITVNEELYNQIVDLAFHRKTLEAIKLLHDSGKPNTNERTSTSNSPQWSLKECKLFVDNIIRNFSDI